MLTKALFFLFCFLTQQIYGKVITISSNGECFAYTHDTGKIEISCKGKTIILTNTSIAQDGAKGQLVGQGAFLEQEIVFSRNNNFLTVPSFGDPTKGAGINGTDRDNLYEILRVNIETEKVDVIVRRKEKIYISNYFDFDPEQMAGINSGDVIMYNHAVLDNGEVIFYADIDDFSRRAKVKWGYFSSNNYGQYYQIITFAKTIRETPIYPEIFGHPTVDKDNKGFYYTLTENGIGKLMYYKGLKKGGENIEIANTAKSYNDEKVIMPTRTMQFEEGILWGNIYPSLFTINEKGNGIFTSRYFNFNTSISDILPTEIGIFATTRPFEEKDPSINSSVNIVINGKPYKVISSGEKTEGKTVGVIRKNIHFVNGKIFFVSNGEVLGKNVNVIQNTEIKDSRLVIKGCFPDLNLERGLQVLLNGVVVVPEGTIPSSLKADKSEISFSIPANVSGKQKVELIFSTIYGPVGAVNNGLEIDFPYIPVELSLEGENHREIVPGEETIINVNSNVLGKFFVSAEDVNGFRPVNIISPGDTRNLNMSLKVLVNTRFNVKFTAVNGEQKEISVFVEVKPPKINEIISLREDKRIIKNDIVYITGVNLSPDGQDHQQVNDEQINIEINGVECGVLFASPEFIIIKIPEFDDEGEFLMKLDVLGRQTSINIRIEKENENDQ